MLITTAPEALDYLSSKDKKLAYVIEKLGPLTRAGEPDLFRAVVHKIIGQQISTKAQETVWQRAQVQLGDISARALVDMSAEEIQRVGISHRKASYIKDFAEQVASGAFDLRAVAGMEDEQAIAALSTLRGIGPWTAEMLLTSTLLRPDIVSFGDFGILRGMRILYRHRELNRDRFERYRRRYSPYGSAASFYLWEIAGGALPELGPDPALKAASLSPKGRKVNNE